MEIIIVLVVLALLLFAAKLYVRGKKARRLEHITHYNIPLAVRRRLEKMYPHLEEGQLDMVLQGLKDFFLFCAQAEKHTIAMPSKIADVAWHEFILLTHAYTEFCQKAYGGYFHHIPAEAMQAPVSAQEGIKRIWRLACANEKVYPRRPSRLPLLFSLDELLNITDGFHYSIEKRNDIPPSDLNVNFAANIGCASGCVGISGNPNEPGKSSWFDRLVRRVGAVVGTILKSIEHD